MNVSIGERWESFVSDIVKNGRYGSASEVVREGLRLVEEREAKLAALRETINASIEAGGEVSDEELDAAVEAKLAELKEQGFRVPKLRWLPSAQANFVEIVEYITRES